MKKILSLAFLGILLTTCTKDSAGPDGCFQEDVLPIFISNCTQSGCHNSKDKKEGYDLSNYDGIMKGITPKHPLQSEIYNTIRGKNPSMPQSPYTKLSAKDLLMIRLWINMGAKNTSNCRNCDTTDYKYSTRISKTMKTWCVGCHNSNNAGGGFDLSDYTGVVNSIASNKLMGSLKHLPGFQPMPKNTNSLQQCEINAIEKWIASGNLNN